MWAAFNTLSLSTLEWQPPQTDSGIDEQWDWWTVAQSVGLWGGGGGLRRLHVLGIIVPHYQYEIRDTFPITLSGSLPLSLSRFASLYRSLLLSPLFLVHFQLSEIKNLLQATSKRKQRQCWQIEKLGVKNESNREKEGERESGKETGRESKGDRDIAVYIFIKKKSNVVRAEAEQKSWEQVRRWMIEPHRGSGWKRNNRAVGGVRRNGRGSGPVSRLLLRFICVEVLIIEMTLTARQTGQTSQANRQAVRRRVRPRQRP